MSYYLIENFKAGLDVRKSALTAPAGTLTRLVNASITPGAEIAKRRAFVKVADVPDTFGLAAIGNTLVMFTRNVDGTPPKVHGLDDIKIEYHKLPITSTTAIVTDYEQFDGKVYVALYDTAGATVKAKNPHFYNDADAGKTPNYVETEGSGMGLYVRAYKSKMYTVGDKYLRFSAIENPKLWEAATDPTDTTRTGAGFINISLQEGQSARLQGIEIYYDRLAVMSEMTCQIWSVVSDPKQNSLGQVLRATGTKAPWSVQQYGSGDILYLAASGIRSLKARDISNSASVSDIGSPIDDYVLTLPEKYGSVNFLYNARSILEPVIGRFWMAFPREIAVLSHFPGPNVTAWSVYTVPFTIDHIVSCGDRIFIRSGNELYLFGGVSGKEFDDSPVEVRLPYHDGGKPGHGKLFQGIDLTATGEWEIRVSYNYDQQDAEETIARINAPTWGKGRYELSGFGTHMSLRFYNNVAGPATISNAAIHYLMAGDTGGV